jgi:hypothetical protein
MAGLVAGSDWGGRVTKDKKRQVIVNSVFRCTLTTGKRKITF